MSDNDSQKGNRMGVYVDDMRTRATVRGRTALWSHLYADTADDLMSFAAKLRLDPSWLQNPGDIEEHFDVTDSKRETAIRLGARPITCAQTGALIIRRALTLRMQLAA